jgi:hypothetical protein
MTDKTHTFNRIPGDVEPAILPLLHTDFHAHLLLGQSTTPSLAMATTVTG